jgi:fused signal recognition particle receptor
MLISMFDFLKKKITGFVDKLTNKEKEKKVKEEVVEEPQEIIEEEKPEEVVEEKPKEIIKEEKPIEIVEKKPAKIVEEEIKKEKLIPKEKPKPKVKVKEKEKPPKKLPEKEHIPEIKEKPKPEKPKPKIEEKKPVPKKIEEKPKPRKEKPEKPKEEKPEVVEEKPALPEYKEEKKKGISLSPFKAIKSFITQEVEISQKDVHELLENLELELLESDVELGVAQSIREELEEKLVGAKIKKKEVDMFIKDIIRSTLIKMMTSEKSFDLLEFIETREKPVKIVFLGINGAGKTTSIAKIAHLLLQNKKKVVFAAADTFRAAAIEQMEVHANRLDVKLIKRDYGADPTSVGYDAMSYAKAHGIDAVLIDTAGRQDTNINLINELKKMDRVLKPDLKLYIGESIAGSSVIEQVSTFNSEVGIDGVILTKLDCDPKGGTILSITKATGIPVIYIGIGQKYEDLERFEANKIIDRLLT